MIEYSITVKDENFRITEKDTSYEPILLSRGCEDLAEMVNKVVEKFNDSILKDKNKDANQTPDIILNFKMVW